MALLNLVADRVELALDILVNLVVVIDTDNGLVRGDFDNIKRVNLPELVLLGHRCTGHTGELLVQSEEVLESDGSEGFALVVNLNAFLSLDSLMQTLIIASAEHQTTGKFINDNNLVALSFFRRTNDIIDVALHDTVCADSLIDVVKKRDIFGVHKVLDSEILLRLSHAVWQEVAGFRLFVNEIIPVKLVVIFFLRVNLNDGIFGKSFSEFIGFLVQIGGVVTASRDDKRSSRLIDKD